MKYIGHILILMGLGVLFLPAVTLGQAQTPKIQIHTGVPSQALFNSSLQALEKSGQEAVSYRLVFSGERSEANSPFEAADMSGGELPGRAFFPHTTLPFAPLRDSSMGASESSTNADGFMGDGLRDLQQAPGDAQKSLTILEGNSKKFTIDLDMEPSGEVTGTITGHENTGLEVTPTQLRFDGSNWNVEQTVTVKENHDSDDMDEEVRLTFRLSGNSTDQEEISISILDDERPVKFVSQTLEEGESKRFFVPLLRALAPPSEDVMFTITGHENTNLTLDRTTLTFPVGTWSENQRLILGSRANTDFRDEHVTLTFTASGGGYTGLKYILDVTIRDRHPYEVLVPEGGSAEYRGKITGNPPDRDPIGVFSGYEGTDLTVNPTKLIFDKNSWGGRFGLESGYETTTLTAGEDPDDEDDLIVIILEIEIVYRGEIHRLSRSVYVRIEDNDAPGLIVNPSRLQIPEGESREFTVKLSDPPLGDLLGTDDVTVTIPSSTGDLSAAPTSLTFTSSDWDREQTVILSAAEDDDNYENDIETVWMEVSGGGYDDERGSVYVEIIDNDIPGRLVVTPTSMTVDEGEMEAFTVELGRQPSGNVTVTVPTPVGDLTAVPSVLRFTAGNWSTPQPVTLSAAQDDDGVADETETLRLTASGADYNDVTAEVSVTIKDDDEGTIDDEGVIVAPDVVPITEGSTTTFEVSLSDAPSANVTVTLNGYEGTDLADTPPSPLSLTFTPADYDIPQTVTLSAAEDPDILDEETITLRLSASGGGYAGVTADVTVTIEDDDEGTIDYEGVIVAPDVVPIREGSTTAFDVSLSDAPSANVTVTLSGYENTDLAGTPPRPLSLIFTPLNYYMPRSVTITASEDEDGFFDEYVTLHLSASDAEYMGVTADVTVRIRDNDTGTIVVPALVIMEEGSERTMEVVLAQMPSSLVTVSFSGYAGTDLSLNGPPLTFTTANWNISQTVVLMAAEDHDLEHDIETLMLTASGGGYTGVMAKTAVTIADNDTAEIVADGEVLMDEGDTYSLPVRLSAQPSAFVTVTFSGHAGTDLALDKATLTFTAADWQTPKQVTLTAIEDDEDYADETIGLTLTASGGDYDEVEAMVPVTIMDNDEEAPLSISIHDAQGVENAGRLQLPIILNRPIDQVVTVQYASTDGTAEAGEDYTTSRGIVIFDPGATRGVIEIEVTDDELPERAETFMVTLSQPRNAIIARETGTGTILDDDGGTAILRVDDALVLEEEGMVRFRVSLSHPQRQLITAAYQTQDGTARAGEDYEASSGVVTLAPGTVEAMIAVPLLKDGLDWQEETFTMHLVSSKHAEIAKAVGVATIQESTTVSEAVLEAYSARFVRTSSAQIVEALGERFRSGADGAACGAADRAEMAQLWYSASEWDPSLGELLSGCRMSASSYSGAFSVWGRGAFRQFNGRTDDALTLNGAVTTGMLGADYRWQRGWLAGVLLAHSRGDGSFEVVEQSGEITAGLTGVYPYVSYTRAGWDVWLSAGAGRGQAEVLELKGDLVSRFGAMGVRGTLMSGGTIGLNYHGDVLVTDAELKDHAVTAEVYRVRAGVEANAKISDGLRPYVEASVRSDGGSAETGIGLEFGGGIRVDYPAWRLKGDVRTQGLVMHTAEGFTEWGLSGSLQVGSRSEGLMVRVRPTWGRGQGMSVYGQQTILDAAPIGAHAHRTELELGYGIPWKDGTARSVMGVTQLPQGMMYRIGGELHPWERLTFSIFGLAHGRATVLGDLGVNVRGSLRY